MYALLISGSLVGSYGGYKKFYEGKDLTSMGTFNEAFKKARADKRKIFRWNGKKFTTDLVDKEFSANYWESKKFLEDYYASDYFKSKQKPRDFDLSGIRSEIGNAAFLRWQELFEKSQSSKSLTKEEKEELKRCRDILSNRNTIDMTEEFKNKVLEWQNKIAEERIAALKEPTYFSITHQKGERDSDGSYKTKTGDVFVYGKKGSLDDTTAVHELGHKSTRSNLAFIRNDKYSEMRDKAFDSAKDNRVFIRKYGQKGFDYLSDPTEIDARQNSVRFWLFKRFPGYTANTIFTEQHFDFLKQNYEQLPYDIRQLVDLFPIRSVFISNMNTY